MQMRAHQIVKLNYTAAGWKRREISIFDSGKIASSRRISRKNKQQAEKLIDEYRKEVEGNEDPDFFEVAVVPPTQDFIVRHAEELTPLITFDANDTEKERFDKYKSIFYESFDLVSEVVCQCVRDPGDLNRRLIVPDSTPDDRMDSDQVRIGEWNIRVNEQLRNAQGFYAPLTTPTCTVFWVAFMLAQSIIVVPKKGKKAEPDVMDENIDAFPEGDSSELAEGSEDPLLEGLSELPVGSLGPGEDDTGRAEGQDRHQSVRTSPEGDQGSTEGESGSEEVS